MKKLLLGFLLISIGIAISFFNARPSLDSNNLSSINLQALIDAKAQSEEGGSGNICWKTLDEYCDEDCSYIVICVGIDCLTVIGRYPQIQRTCSS